MRFLLKQEKSQATKQIILITISIEIVMYLPIADKTRTAPNHLNILICCRQRIKSNGSDIRSDYLQISTPLNACVAKQRSV